MNNKRNLAKKQFYASSTIAGVSKISCPANWWRGMNRYKRSKGIRSAMSRNKFHQEQQVMLRED